MTGPAPIENYALLSDLRTAALVGNDGSIDWLCLPRFDSPSCFSRLLGSEENGHWRICPVGPVIEVTRRYRDRSFVLETEFRTESGVVRLIDAMTPNAADNDDDPEVVRIVEGVEGSVEVEMRWVIRFAYGHAVPWVRRVDGGILAVAGPQGVVLRGDQLPERDPERRAHCMQIEVGAGDRLHWSMQWVPPSTDDVLPAPIDPDGCVQAAEDFWADWSSCLDVQGPHAEVIERSLVTLKALTYAPSGAMVAAPTTSLPEVLGGDRNWDYRYCWLRDASLTLLALDSFGLHDEARDWCRWLLRSVAGDPAEMQIMYGLEGERHLVEWEADWLPGYKGAAPVRVGNAAHGQLQHDVYGEVMDALHIGRERGIEGDGEAWALQLALLSHLEKVWREPDQGLWEVRGPARHFTHSKVMAWLAFDRAVRAVRDHGMDGPADHWEEIRDEVHAEVMERGWSDEVGAFTQHYDTSELDAATLLIPAVGFLPGDHPRATSTLEAIGASLKDGDVVRRYLTHPGDDSVDGLAGREGGFLLCSFWYVDALTLAGRRQEAEEMFGRLAGLANDVGLLAEEYDPDTGQFLGNFPQAFSHLGLAGSAALLWGGASRGDPRQDA